MSVKETKICNKKNNIRKKKNSGGNDRFLHQGSSLKRRSRNARVRTSPHPDGGRGDVDFGHHQL